MQEARPEEMQRLIRLLVRKIEWQPEGNQAIEFFALPQLSQKSRQIKNEKTSPETNQDWFATLVGYGCPRHRDLKPVILRAVYSATNIIDEALSNMLRICNGGIM